MGKQPTNATQRGMTLVELMIGLAVGLFIVAMALGLAVGQLRNDRTLIQESRLVIGLGTATDAVTHELRRAGYRGDAGVGIARIASPVIPNPYAGVSWSASDQTLLMTYSRDLSEDEIVSSTENFRFKLDAGAIKMKIGDGTWQPVTDPGTLTVTAFSITPIVQEVALGSFCEKPCPATDATCPRQQVWRYDVEIAGHLMTDASVTPVVRSSVRVRNDLVTGACPA